jgi:iron complex outermembrane receptor protein
VKGGRGLEGIPPVSTTSLRQGLGLSFALAALASAPAAAAAAPSQAYDIEAGPLDAALLAFADQSHIQLIFAAATVADLSAPALKGRFTTQAGLARLLAASGASAMQSRPGVIVIKPRPGGAGGAPRSAVGAGAFAHPLDPDPAEDASKPVAALGPGPAEVLGQAPGRSFGQTEVTEVVVTGSLIRGQARGPSPLKVLTRDQLDRTGRASLAEVLADLPQNFAATASPQTAVLGSDRVGTNDVVASGVNLRGLGANATLVLVNGRRMAGAGLMGDFADVSAIPTAAIDHVEILLDGASALYGSDAVGGVVNIILRQDFDGAETRVRYGLASGGVASDRQVAQTFGRTWSGGGLLLSYEYDRQDALAGSARAYTASANLTGLGGSDHRLVYGLPGNIMRYDQASGAYVPGWAIVPGQAGSGPGFVAGQVNLGDQRAGADILPAQTRHSLYASFRQALGARVRFTADARYSLRQFDYRLPGSPALLQVTRANPYFVSPDAAPYDLIAYGFTGELGPLRSTGSSQSLGASAGLTADVGQTWQGEVWGAFAQESGRRSSTHRLNTHFLAEALGTIPDDPATAFSTARDGFFNPYGDGHANSQQVLDFIGGGFVRTHDLSQVATLSGKTDGRLASLPGGDLKLALGFQLRQERFVSSSVGMTSRATPTVTEAGPYDRTIGAAFLELSAPIVGPANAVPGVERLEVSIAGRAEVYSRIGTTFNPKLGLVWSPAAGVVIKTSYGTSFRAPALSEMYQAQDVGPAFLPLGAAQKLVLLRFGGNPDLKPQTARSWTVNLEFQPPAAPDLKLGLGWFDTNFTAQISQPVGNDIFNALGNPIYSAFVRYLDPHNLADETLVGALLAQSSSSSAGLFPPSAYAAVVDARFVNTGGLHVAGLDASAAYSWRFGSDRLDASADASILTDYRLQVTSKALPTQMLDRPGQPLRLRVKAAASWTHGPYGVSLGLNQTGGYHAGAGHNIAPWTTVDLQLRWRPADSQGPLKGVMLALSAQNLFDTAPPFYDAPQGVGYDAANANALGRVVSVELTKRW